MATLKQYTCKSCGYSVYATPQGHHGMMSGEHYQFRCTKCKDIVSIQADNLAQQGYAPTCPQCGATNENLYSWNAVDGKCPKCNGSMKLDENGLMMMAD